jgi:hypothetical protein
MKIKAYFVTYDNDLELNKTLKTFEKSGIKNYDYEIKVINNFRDAPVLLDDVKLQVEVINNNTRPSFSTGHLARNWNECLIDGFKDLLNPDSDIVILSQNDVQYNEDVIDSLVECHKDYSFISAGCGDAFHSYTVDAIKSVGLWDERFCNIGWQDCDYFLRQMIYNKENSSVNDPLHHRVHNKIDYQFVEIEKQSGFVRHDVHHLTSMKFHETSMKVFIKKWGKGVPGMHWSGPMDQYEGPGTYRTALDIGPEIVVKSPQWIMYPFFESKIADLKNKNYINYEAQD